jgi:UPF0755 protein
MKSSNGKKKKIVVKLGVAGAVLLACVYYIFLMPNYYSDQKGKLVTISRGMSFRVAVDSLIEAGVIRNKWSFELAGRILGASKSIKVGKYLFVSGQSNYDILRDINYGRSRVIIPVTIVEGWRLEKIAHRFAHDLGVDEKIFLSLCQDEKFIHSHGINASSLQGYLLPETYSFYWQPEEQEILTRILNGFKQFYNDSLLKRQELLGKTQLEILTLASIIEAESNVDEERPKVAGVYWNRLKKNMRLEADPTVQYALGEGRRLRFLDLELESPYNTYRHIGLPPAPINNPGKLSILAALYPEQHEYLFFVATGTGGHRFAKNYSDHQKNIRLYHRTKREVKHLSSK